MTTEERLQNHLNKTPIVDPTAWVAPSADVMGDVTIGPKSSVFYQCVVRGDIGCIVVGEGTNIQDGAIIHLADDFAAIIGDYVTIGHQALVHACTVESECLIGMCSTILDGSIIGRKSIVAAGAVVLSGTVVPPGSMVKGIPAKITPLGEDRQAGLREWAEKYILVAAAHRKKFGGVQF
ncbi:MAG: gamma carbonic anhydrase family protein [Opitutaceae bacterium]|nr:gamma carbonic anhydrase family protein [Opitutaceae bacterium]|tara:strand:- start:4820 stop:5356 length:537 start_codon:yes stop_codon:yes gene_type:complete